MPVVALNVVWHSVHRNRLSLREWIVIWVWLFFDDVHLMISRCGTGLERWVWPGWETVSRCEA